MFVFVCTCVFMLIPIPFVSLLLEKYNLQLRNVLFHYAFSNINITLVT